MQEMKSIFLTASCPLFAPEPAVAPPRPPPWPVLKRYEALKGKIVYAVT